MYKLIFFFSVYNLDENYLAANLRFPLTKHRAPVTPQLSRCEEWLNGGGAVCPVLYHSVT